MRPLIGIGIALVILSFLLLIAGGFAFAGIVLILGAAVTGLGIIVAAAVRARRATQKAFE